MLICTPCLAPCDDHLNNIHQEAKTFITYDMAGVDQKDFALTAQLALIKRGFDLKLPEEDFEEYTKDDE